MSDKREYIVPALPGWSVVRLIDDGSNRFTERDVYEEPIIAWQLETEPSRMDRWRVVHTPVPITMEGGMTSELEVWAIKTPLGVYEIQADQTCDTLQDFLKVANAKSKRGKGGKADSEIKGRLQHKSTSHQSKSKTPIA